MTIPAIYPRSALPRAPMRPSPDGLPMFGWVARGAVARSAQPTTSGFRSLAAMGFKTVVSLRAEGDGDGDLARGCGLTLVRLPWIDELAPTGEDARKWLEIAKDPERWPLLVHCKAGAGRTGVACALLRFTFDGWPMSLAREEIRLYRPGIGPFRWPMAAAQKYFLSLWALTHQPGVYP